MLPTPANYPELKAAAERFHAAVKEAKAAGLDQAALRMAIKRACGDYMLVFGTVARQYPDADEKEAAAGDDPGRPQVRHVMTTSHARSSS
jgi:hypothetical protein